MSIIAGLGTVGLAFLWAAWRHRSALRPTTFIARGAVLLATLVVATTVAVGSIVVGTMLAGTHNGTSTKTDATGDVVDRIFFRTPARP